MLKKINLKYIFLFLILILLISCHLNGSFLKWNLSSFSNFWSNETDAIVLRELHLPRTFAVLIAGSSLSIAGLLMQTFFRNPLTGPSILGISSGSSLFVSLTIMTSSIFNTNFSIITSAILGALFFSIIILSFSFKVKSSTSLLIIGVMLAAFTNSIIQLIQSESTIEALRSFTIWGFGSVQHINFNQIPIISVVFIVSLISLIFLIKPLNLLIIGEKNAQFLGLNPRKIRWILILISSTFTGLVTAFCGPISFIGLAVPNLVKLIFKTTDHKKLILGSIILGSIFLLLCDLITYQLEDIIHIPLNSITSLFGAPIVIWIILKNKLHD
jgi:iron complex transport system permease protein